MGASNGCKEIGFDYLKGLIDEWYAALHTELTNELKKLLRAAFSAQCDSYYQEIWSPILESAFPLEGQGQASTKGRIDGEIAESWLHGCGHQETMQTLSAEYGMYQSHQSLFGQEPLTKRQESISRMIKAFGFEQSILVADPDDHKNLTPPAPILKKKLYRVTQLNNYFSKLIRRIGAVRELKNYLNQAPNKVITKTIRISVFSAVATAKENEPHWAELPLITKIIDCITLSLSYRYRIWQSNKIAKQVETISLDPPSCPQGK